jgi:pyridoxine/pyridoxamine 5'-phosphate oxidase
MLLLKDVDHRGVFYPNLQSRKARHKREVYTRQLVVG